MYTYHRREIIRELEDDDKNWIKNKSAASGLHLSHIRQGLQAGRAHIWQRHAIYIAGQPTVVHMGWRLLASCCPQNSVP